MSSGVGSARRPRDSHRVQRACRRVRPAAGPDAAADCRFSSSNSSRQTTSATKNSASLVRLQVHTADRARWRWTWRSSEPACPAWAVGYLAALPGHTDRKPRQIVCTSRCPSLSSSECTRTLAPDHIDRCRARNTATGRRADPNRHRFPGRALAKLRGCRSLGPNRSGAEASNATDSSTSRARDDGS